MAGPIRQPIDLKSLEKYIENEVPEIKTPLEVKQVGRARQVDRVMLGEERATDTLLSVRLWPIQPNLPSYRFRRRQVCYA